MSKAKSERGAKSAAVREYLKDHKDAGPSEVVAALKEKGLEITAALVSNIKAKGGKPKSKRKARKARVSVQDRTIQYVESVGGLSAAKAALAELEQNINRFGKLAA